MNQVLGSLAETGALLEGHFLLSSGLHSGRYCQCAKLFERPELAGRVLEVVAAQLKNVEYDLIVGPAMGGIIAAYELSRQTGKPNIFTERVDNIMCLRRGFTVEQGQRAIIMEDVITTGKSTKETAEVLTAMGVIVVGAACVADRSSGPLPFPVYPAVKLEIDAYDSADCPLCKENKLPLIKPGSRKLETT